MFFSAFLLLLKSFWSLAADSFWFISMLGAPQSLGAVRLWVVAADFARPLLQFYGSAIEVLLAVRSAFRRAALARLGFLS